MLSLSTPYPFFTDKGGDPLDAGFIYIGQVSQNPETAPVTVYWDEAGTQPAAQPLRTLNGYIVRNGTPTRAYVAGDGFSMSVKNSRGVLLYYERQAAGFASLGSSTDPDGGAGQVGFGGTLDYPENTIGWAEQQRGVMACWIPGYDPTGVADSTLAIQTAISVATVLETYTVLITGKPRITTSLSYSVMLALVGVNGGDAFSNNFDTYPNRIRCGDVTGYVFDQPDVVDGSGGLSLTNLCFDGRTSAGVRSTSLTGFVKSATTSGTSSFYLRGVNCMFGNGDSTGDMFNLDGQVFSHFHNTMFSKWHFGRVIKSGGSSTIGTTQTWEKCYFTSARQVAEFTSDTTDAHFLYCAIESCVTGVASVSNNVTFTGGYSENMGYDDSGTGITTGISDRALGFTDAPVISGKVNAVFTCRFGQMVFRDYTFLATTGGKKWFDGIGRTNGTNSGGVIIVENLSLAAGTINTLFTADGDTPSSRGSFEYHMTVKRGSPTVLTAADARMLTLGRVPIQWSDGTTRPVDVCAGLFSVPPLTVNGFSAVPATYPDGGAWVIGDTAYKSPASLLQGTASAWIVTTAGTTGAQFDTHQFTAWSKSEAVTTGNNFVIPVQLVEVGTVYVYEISATNAAATTQQYHATVRITHLASGSSAVVAEDLDLGATTISYTHTNPITVANASGVTLTYYGRLVSVGRTHA